MDESECDKRKVSTNPHSQHECDEWEAVGGGWSEHRPTQKQEKELPKQTDTHSQMLGLSKTICLDQPKSRKHTLTVTKQFGIQASNNGELVVPQEYIRSDATVHNGVYAVGDVDDDSTSSDNDNELRADAILDGQHVWCS